MGRGIGPKKVHRRGGGIDGRHVRAALPKGFGHDFSDSRRSFDEKHLNAVQTWSSIP